MKKIITFDKSLEFKSMVGEITSISLEHDLKFIDQSNIEGNFYVSGSYKLTEASQIEEKFSFDVPVEISLPETISLDTSKIEIEDFNYEIENEDTMLCHINVLIQGVEEVRTEELDEKDDLEIKENDEVDIREYIDNEEEKIDISKCKEIDVRQCEEKDVRECDGDEKDKTNTIDEDGIKEIEPIHEEHINIQEIINEFKKEDKEVTNNMEEITIEKEEITLTKTSNVGSLFSSFKDEDETFSTYSIYIVRSNETIESIIEKYKVKREDLENYNDLSNIQIGTKLIIPTTNE